MEENRDQILIDFQSCTGIDDIGECILYLEASNWNLLNAIQTVMTDESQTLPSERDDDMPMEISNAAPDVPPREINELNPSDNNIRKTARRSNRLVNNTRQRGGEQNAEPIGNSSSGEGANNEFQRESPPMIINDIIGHDVGPSNSHNSHLLHFEVTFKDNVVPLEVPDTATVGEIKTALHAELGIPVCRQELCGWHHNHISDDTLLASLQLPSRTKLFLTSNEPTSGPSTSSNNMSSYEQSLNKNHQLYIIDTTNNKEYDLYFHGSKTILEVKLGCQDVTNIPVRFQRWIGWPDAAKDENMTLAALEFESPLELMLSREDNAKPKKQLVIDLTSSDSSENEFEDAPECFGVDDEMFHTGAASTRIRPLMPLGMDEIAAVHNFKREFINRYGPAHPNFFQGTLVDAIQSSCLKPARERHPLCIYLHHDASILTNVFCTQLLCSESVISYLNTNFVTWAWDITEESNKTRFINMMSLHLGMLANTIMNMPLDNMPALLIISKVRSVSEVLTVIPGNVGLDELITRLLHSIEVFNSEISSEIREEDEREARELVKREQDAAYEASLMADRAKEEARRQEEEKKQLEDREARRKELEDEMLFKKAEALKKQKQMSLAGQLPPEPKDDSSLPISHIRMRLPNGIMMERRFLASDQLEVLFKYLASKGYPKETFKVLSSWPRRDLITLDSRHTLQELKLYPKETLTLEER